MEPGMCKGIKCLCECEGGRFVSHREEGKIWEKITVEGEDKAVAVDGEGIHMMYLGRHHRCWEPHFVFGVMMRCYHPGEAEGVAVALEWRSLWERVYDDRLRMES